MAARPPGPQSEAPPEPVRPPEATGPVRQTKDGCQINVGSVDEAKEAILQLKDQKRDLQATKKEVAAEHADLRAVHAEKRAGRHVLPRGGGKFGQHCPLLRPVEPTFRAPRSMQQENQAYNDRKQAIDRQGSNRSMP